MLRQYTLHRLHPRRLRGEWVGPFRLRLLQHRVPAPADHLAYVVRHVLGTGKQVAKNNVQALVALDEPEQLVVAALLCPPVR